MRIRELARLMQAHPRASARTVAMGRRLLREAEMADALDAEADTGAMNNDPTGADDTELNQAAAAGFQQIVSLLIGRVFDGSAEWADVRAQLDTVFDSLDAILAGSPSDAGSVAESLLGSSSSAALRRRGRKLAESIKSDAPEGNGTYIPTGKRFAASIRGE